MTSRTGSARRILGILKKVSRVENWTPNEKGWLSLARGGFGKVLHEIGGGGRWQSQNRKNVYLSPYVEEPLNSKVIKSFVPEQRSPKCFSCFEIPMFYLYGHSMYVSHSHIGVMVHDPGDTHALIRECCAYCQYRSDYSWILVSVSVMMPC